MLWNIQLAPSPWWKQWTLSTHWLEWFIALSRSFNSKLYSLIILIQFPAISSIVRVLWLDNWTFCMISDYVHAFVSLKQNNFDHMRSNEVLNDVKVLILTEHTFFGDWHVQWTNVIYHLIWSDELRLERALDSVKWTESRLSRIWTLDMHTVQKCFANYTSKCMFKIIDYSQICKFRSIFDQI